MKSAAQLEVLSLAIFHSTAAFVSPRIFGCGGNWGASRVSLVLESALAKPEGESFCGESDLPQNLPSGVELWLDLRGTAILPSAALSHLSDDLWGEFDALAARGKSMVDRVLVSEANLQKALYHIDSEDHVDTFFVRDEDDALIDAKDQSTVGRLISLKENEMVDPIPAMDTVSLGEWAVVDSSDIEDTEKKRDAVSGLVEFLSSGATAPAGLLLGGAWEGNNAGKEPSGGIVLCCQSKADVLNSGALIQSSSGSFTTTDSGIIVQTETTDAELGNVSTDAPFKSAVAIPFDMNLWKTASFVFGGEIEN